jgi:O-antigen ligase
MKLKSFREHNRIFSILFYTFYILLLASLVFSFRAVSSISIALIILTFLIKNKLLDGFFFPNKIFTILFTGCILFYFLQAIAFLNTENTSEGWRHIILKSGLIFIPLAVTGSGFINKKSRTSLMHGFIILLLIASLYCLAAAYLRYSLTRDELTFFYHELVKPFGHHAVFFSIMVFIVLVFLLEGFRNKFVLFGSPLHVFLVLYFTVFLFLLSSRLVISFYALYLVYFFIGLLKNKTYIAGILLIIAGGIVLILLSKNPISLRFYDLLKENTGVLKREKFDPGIYFNGFEFRLLQWRLVPEILTENKSWFTGVTPGDGQHILDKKYIEKKMYTGDPLLDDRGYLGFNTHNQFLESLLQSGIPGLLVFTLIFFSLFKMVLIKKNRMMSFITILLLIYSFTESVFETQYGLLLFTFFPLFFYQEMNKNKMAV